MHGNQLGHPLIQKLEKENKNHDVRRKGENGKKFFPPGSVDVVAVRPWRRTGEICISLLVCQ